MCFSFIISLALYIVVHIKFITLNMPIPELHRIFHCSMIDMFKRFSDGGMSKTYSLPLINKCSYLRCLNFPIRTGMQADSVWCTFEPFFF